MIEKEYKERKAKIEASYQLEIFNLKQDIIKKYSKYKIGDFIFNVTGLIKIEKIKLEIICNQPCIKYYGFKYRRFGNIISKTKTYNKSHHCLSTNIKLLDISKYEIV